jgi:hypothetical protein
MKDESVKQTRGDHYVVRRAYRPLFLSLFFILHPSSFILSSGWYSIDPIRAERGGNGKLLAEILAACPPGQEQQTGSLITIAHETTHAVNARVRNSFGDGSRFNAFYVGQRTACVLREPRVRLRAVLSFVPAELRHTGARLYLFEQAAHFEWQPLNILDEWTAYTNGTQAGLDAGQSEAHSLERTVEFCAYATALLLAVEKFDPSYADREPLCEFIAWQLERVLQLVERSRQAGVWQPVHETLLSNFQRRFVKEP